MNYNTTKRYQNAQGGGGLGSGGGNLLYSIAEPTNRGVGNIPVGSVLFGKNAIEIFEQMFNAIDPPAAQIQLVNPSAGTKLIGTTFNSIEIRGTAIKRTNNIERMEYFVGSTLVHTQTFSPPATSNQVYIHVHSFAPGLLFSNTSFTVKVFDASGLQGQASASVNFNHYRYWGRSATDVISETNETTLSTLVQNLSKEFGTGSNFAPKTISASNEYLVVCFRGSGTPAFVLNGLPNTAFVGKSFNFTNAAGHVDTFQIWRSGAKLSGTYTLDIN